MLSVSTIITVGTAIISIVCFSNHKLMNQLILNPYSVNKYNQWYRLLTCGLIHANWPHLIFNMIALWSFGQAVEFYYHDYFGSVGTLNFILLYAGGQLFSVLPSYAKHKEYMGYNSLGASGAVSAVIFASILFNPWNPIYLFIFKIPGIVFGVAYLAYSQYMSNKGGDNINHDAHFYGALYGVMFTLLVPTQLDQKPIGLEFLNLLLHPSFLQ